MKLLRLVWRKVAEPRVHRTGFFVIYLLHTLGGLAILSTVLGDYRLVLGEVITTVWSGFLVLGGVTGAASVLSGRNYIERVGILSLFVGFVLAVIVLSATPPSPGGLALWCILVGWLVVFALRIWEIRLYLVAPKE
jgi:hypothetical protein